MYLLFSGVNDVYKFKELSVVTFTTGNPFECQSNVSFTALSNVMAFYVVIFQNSSIPKAITFAVFIFVSLFDLIFVLWRSRLDNIGFYSNIRLKERGLVQPLTLQDPFQRRLTRVQCANLHKTRLKIIRKETPGR